MGTYDPFLVLLSIIVAIAASYVALDLTARLAVSNRTKAGRFFWLTGGTLSMGIGIWSMHFIGMLAFHSRIPIFYDVWITLLSLLMAIAASGVALSRAMRETLSTSSLLTAGVLMAIGIVSMHYTGMAAMRMNPPLKYNAFLFTLSILIALVGSTIGLWSAFTLRYETIFSAFWKKVGSALLMGTAIYGMHYVGMWAAIFAPNSVSSGTRHIDRVLLAGILGTFTLLFLAAILIISAFDAYVAGQSSKHAKALKELNTALAFQKMTIFETSLDAVISMDHQGIIIEFNKSAEQIFGCRRAEAVGKELASLIIPPHLREIHRRGLAKYLATGEGPVIGCRNEFPALRADGTEFVAELSISRMSMDGPPQFMGFIRDITGKKRCEEKNRFLADASKILSESLDSVLVLKKLSRLAVERLGDWCVVNAVSEEGIIQGVVVTPRDPSQIPITQKLENLSQNSEASGGVANAINIGEDILFPDPKQDETTSTRNAGVLAIEPRDAEKRKWVDKLGAISFVTVLMKTNSGIIVGAITLVSSDPRRIYDKQDLDLMREIARRAAYAVENARLFSKVAMALRTRDEFLSIASHELKTPLTSMKIQTQLIGLLGLRNEQAIYSIENLKNFIRDTDHQINRLTQLVDDMLDVSRVSTGSLVLRLESFNLTALIREVVQRLEPLLLISGCSIKINIPKEITGRWDRYRIEQALVNLLTNAAKYGAGKPVEVEASVKGDKVVLTVRDYGRGIAARNHERIFYRFERAVDAKDVSGFGLGLYITHHIVTMHQGKITVESELGRGAKFTVTMPLRVDEAAENAAA